MKEILKWNGMVGGGILAMLLLALFGLSFSVSTRLDGRYDIAPEPVVIPTNLAAIEEGRRLVTIHCTGCHGDNVGGADFFNDPTLAVIDAPNLTRGQGGVGAHFSDADWVRAIRHGIDPTGRPLLIMPSRNYYHFSDEDLGKVIAYLKHAPPVDHETNDRSTTLLGCALVGVGAFSNLIDAETIDHTAARPTAPTPGETVAYGSRS